MMGENVLQNQFLGFKLDSMEFTKEKIWKLCSVPHSLPPTPPKGYILPCCPTPYSLKNGHVAQK